MKFNKYNLLRIVAMRNKKVILIIISVVLLLLGLLLYLLLNQEAYVSKAILAVIPIQITIAENIFVKILKGYAADLLWSVSFTMIVQFIVFILAIKATSSEKNKLKYLILCCLLGIVYELMQYFRITSGIADIVDVIVYILGSLLAIIIIQGGKLYEEKSDCSVGVSD